MLKINVPLNADGNIKSLGPIHGAMAIKKKYDVDVTVDLVPFETTEALRKAELAQANQVCKVETPTFGDLLDQAEVANFKNKLKPVKPANDAPKYLSLPRDQYLTTPEVAELLGMKAWSVYTNKRLQKKLGKIQHGKGCTVKYPKCKVDAYVKRLAV